MDMKEKLVELLYEIHSKLTDECCMGGKDMSYAEQVGAEADHLITNGVTVQEWISVKDRLPDKQEYDWVLVQLKLVPEEAYGVPCVAELRNGDWYDAEGCWIGTDPEGGCVIVTHWMPLPQPPKGE